jgi:hypothetical protein
VTVDAGTIDAGTIDAGTIDAGTIDAGTIDAPSDLDALLVDAFVGASDAGLDASSSADDAFALDAAAARDAATAPDAFASTDAFTPDAFTPSPDAFTPPPDAFTPPPDAFTPPPDAFTLRPDAFAFPRCGEPDLAVPAIPAPPALVISEIDPGTFIEVYNTTSSDIPLSSTAYQLCSPFVYAALATLGAGVVVPARGYATLPWPGSFSDTEAGGEISLYTNGSFADPLAVMSFVCWGTNPHGTRKSTAEAGGRWSGPCASAITAGRSIARTPGNTGSTSRDYSTAATPSPETCGP